jgi:hypothetical protein
MLRPAPGVLSIYLTISIKNSFITKQNINPTMLDLWDTLYIPTSTNTVPVLSRKNANKILTQLFPPTELSNMGASRIMRRSHYFRENEKQMYGDLAEHRSDSKFK